MPTWLKWLLVIVIVLLVGTNIYLFVTLQKTAHKVMVIDTYLGNNQGDNENGWSGLTGNIRKNNTDLRNLLTQMGCDIWKLQNPGSSTPCPGGPGTVPSNPPTYPP